MRGGDHAASNHHHLSVGALCCCRWRSGATRTRSRRRPSGRATRGCSSAPCAGPRTAHGCARAGRAAFRAAAYGCSADCSPGSTALGRTAFRAARTERSTCRDASRGAAAHASAAFCATAVGSAKPAKAGFRAAWFWCPRHRRPWITTGSSCGTQGRARSHTVSITA